MACLSTTTFKRFDHTWKAAAPRSPAAAFLALATAITAAALFAGCGKGGVAYANNQYRFALSYDAALTPTSHVTATVSGGAGPAFMVAFLDPAAPRAGDRYVDGVWVAVMRLSAGAHWPPASAMAAELRRGLAASVIGELHGSVTQAIERTANGHPAWAVGYDYRVGGTAVRALTYVVVGSDYEYQVTLQTAATRWAAMLPRLVRSVDSFSIR